MRPVSTLPVRRNAGAPPRRRASRNRPAQSTFYFDLASPYTYLAAERVERGFARLRWRPASSQALRCGALTDEHERATITRRAARLGLPIVWPVVDGPIEMTAAMRVAALADERGVGGDFVLAASRLVYCGGFDIDDPTILEEAAAASGILAEDMLAAACDTARDGPIHERGRRLVEAGADRLPVLRMGSRLFCGEDRLSEAVAARRSA